MLPLGARVDLGAMGMVRYSAFPRAHTYWNLTIRLFSVISWILVEESYPSAEKQSVYCIAPADWILHCCNIYIYICVCVCVCVCVRVYDGNDGILCIPQSSSITGTSPSDCLMSYPRHLFG